MHGVIFFQLNSFVVKNFGIRKWQELLHKKGIDSKMYLPTQVYPDAEFSALVGCLSEVTGKTTEEILEELGKFIVPSMLKVYGNSINPDWNLFDILENTETVMHGAVRHADKKADPPKLLCERISPNKVVIKYSSHRKIVELGIGIIKGIARAKAEKIVIKRSDLDDSTYIEVIRKPNLL